MFSEILKIKPQLDSGDLNSMVNNLSGRFASVAKKFGSGLKSAILGGGITGLAISVIDRLLNPLKETQETIDKILHQSDDIVTSAKQFETTAGKYFKLQQLAKSTGLDEEVLKTMLGKFQVALAQTRADEIDPSKSLADRQKNPLRNFIDVKDTADAFFQFAQAIQKQPKDKQVLIQQDIFGEKLFGKAAEFFQTDFPDQLNKIGAKASESYTPALEKGAKLSDLQDALTAKRTLDDVVTKSNLINENMVFSKDKAERKLNEQDDKRIQSYESMKNIDNAMVNIQQKIENLLLYFEKSVVQGSEISSKVDNVVKSVQDTGSSISNALRKVTESRPVRGVLDFLGIEKVK
jgi:hypothetical protein